MGHAADVFAAQPGDLLLTIKIKEHAYFKREQKNIETEVPISLVEAVLGAKLTIQTLDGPLTIVTKPGMCTGDTMTLKHYGIPEFNPPENYDPQQLRGDHIVKFRIVLPKYDPNGQTKQDQLLRKIVELDSLNKHKYYADYEKQQSEKSS